MKIELVGHEPLIDLSKLEFHADLAYAARAIWRVTLDDGDVLDWHSAIKHIVPGTMGRRYLRSEITQEVIDAFLSNMRDAVEKKASRENSKLHPGSA